MQHDKPEPLSFLGRELELRTLQSRWAKVSDIADPCPQFVTVLGEPGLGKTRLIMEFYRWLAGQYASDGGGYWPDASTAIGQNIDVNPDPRGCDFSRSIPFLWWGIRSQEVVGENALRCDALGSYQDFLAPHLAALSVRSATLETGKKIGQIWLEWAKGEALNASGLSLAVSLGENILGTYDLIKERMGAGARDFDVGAEEAARRTSRADQLLDSLEAAFNPNKVTYAKRPGVIFVDDAQHIGSDVGLPEFVSQLIYRATAQSWPLLVVATHWRQEYYRPHDDPRAYSTILKCARGELDGVKLGLPTGFMEAAAQELIDLRPIDDLSDALAERMPGLTTPQVSSLTERTGGNPRYLQQLVLFLLENEDYFDNYDTASLLTDEGLKAALKASQDMDRLLNKRLRKAPIEIQEALCIAASVGMSFPPEVVEKLYERHLQKKAEGELHKAERPYSMVRPRPQQVEVEFAEKLFYDAAQRRRKSIATVADEKLLKESLKAVLKEELPKLDEFAKRGTRFPLGTDHASVVRSRKKTFAFRDVFLRLCVETFECTKDDAPHLLHALADWSRGMEGAASKVTSDRMIEVFKAFPDARSAKGLKSNRRIAEVLAEAGHHDVALVLWSEQLHTVEAWVDLWGGQDDWREVLNILVNMARSNLLLGRIAESEQLFSRALTVCMELEANGDLRGNARLGGLTSTGKVALEIGASQSASDFFAATLRCSPISGR